METAAKSKRTSISLHYHPFKFDEKLHAVEKSDDGGIKRRYVAGVSSGPKIDGHGERMTENCIKDFLQQGNSGQVLLYPDIHGIKASQDIGILTKAKVLDNGDWYTEYRLYDAMDEVGANKLEVSDTVWKQLNGLPPYKKPLQKGFSVEGFIPEGEILEAQKDEATGMLKNRVINKIDLDGVVIVPRPAYKDGIAHGVYKALGEMNPFKKEKVRNSIAGELRKKLNDEELRDKYYRKKWDVQEALEKTIEKIMKNADIVDKRQALEIALDEYKAIMVELIMKSESLFVYEDAPDEQTDAFGVAKGNSKMEVLKALHSELGKLVKVMKQKIKGEE